MGRAPDPIHWFIIAIGKTAEWAITYAQLYANEPGEAVGASVKIKPVPPAPPQQQENDNA